jgi:hypothetical protein
MEDNKVSFTISTQKIGVCFALDWGNMDKDALAAFDEAEDNLGEIMLALPFAEGYEGMCMNRAGGVTFRYDPSGVDGVKSIQEAERMVQEAMMRAFAPYKSINY